MRDAYPTIAARVLAMMLAAATCVFPGLLRAQGEQNAVPSGPGATVDRTDQNEGLLPAIWDAMRGGLGPVRWGGLTGIDLRSQRSTGNATRQHREFLNLNAATYLFQPWFAQLSGGIELSSAADSPGGTSSTGVTGNGAMQVFPLSRFPFYGYFNVSDSRTSGELTGSDFTNTRYGIRQTYRPVQGAATYTGSYDRSTLSSGSFGDDTVTSLSGQYNNAFGPHGINVSGNRSRNDRALGEGSTIDNYTSRYSWRPDDTLQVENLASFNRSSFHLLSNGALPENSNQVTQLSSFGIWRPASEKPLTVSGGLRYFQAESVLADTSGDSQSTNANIAANYSLTPYTQTFGAAAITQTNAGSNSALITTQSAGVNHSPQSQMFGAYRYGWNTGGSVSNQTGGENGGRQNVSAQIGHNLTRTDTLGGNASLTTTANQSYSAAIDTGNSSGQTVSHLASTAWRKSPTASSSVYLSASASDSRTVGDNESEFQMLNLQMSGQLQFSRHAFGSANVTAQSYRQSSVNTPDTGFRNVVTGSVSYQHNRAFGVPQLRYSLLGQVNTIPQETRLTGDINASRETVTYSIEQRLDYNIGRLEMRLLARVAEINNQRNMQIFLRLSRRFGAF